MKISLFIYGKFLHALIKQSKVDDDTVCNDSCEQNKLSDGYYDRQSIFSKFAAQRIYLSDGNNGHYHS